MQMGLGLLGDPNIIFKRKFRWTFEVDDICSGTRQSIPPSYVKVASRPSLDIEETQIDYLNGRTWIPGKGSWNTIQVTYYDISVPAGSGFSGAGDVLSIFTWIRSVYDYADPVQLNNGARRANYAATGVLTLYDGCGGPLEQWILNDMWPQAIEFGDLDMGSSDTCDIMLTLRFSNVRFTNLCGRQPAPPCCTSC